MNLEPTSRSPAISTMVYLALLVGLILLPSAALAGNLAPGDMSVGDMLGSVLTPMFDAAKELFGTYLELGRRFLAMALVLECLWLVYDYFIRGGYQALFSSVFQLVIIFMIPFMMFATWPNLPIVLMDFFTNGLAQILSIPGFESAGGGGSETLSHAFDELLRTVFDVLYASHPTEGASWGQEIGWWFAWVFSIVIMMIPVMIVGLALVTALYGPMLMLHIGIILAPLIIPWLVWRPLRDFGFKWFSFMIHMGFSFLVGIILASIAIKGLEGYAEVVHAAAEAEGTGAIALLVGLIPMLIMLLFIAWSLMRVEVIATSIVGGVGTGIGSGIAGGAAGVAKKAKMTSGKSKTPPPPQSSPPPRPSKPPQIRGT